MNKSFLTVLCAVDGMAAFGQEAAAESDPYADFDIRDKTLFNYRGNGGSIVIPPGVTAIGYAAFHGCHDIISVSIPTGVTSIIGKHTFFGCTRISKSAFRDVQGSFRYRD